MTGRVAPYPKYGAAAVPIQSNIGRRPHTKAGHHRERTHPIRLAPRETEHLVQLGFHAPSRASALAPAAWAPHLQSALRWHEPAAEAERCIPALGVARRDHTPTYKPQIE